VGMVAFGANKLGRVAIIVSHTVDTTAAGRGVASNGTKSSTRKSAKSNLVSYSSAKTETWFPASSLRAGRSEGEVGSPNDLEKDRNVSAGQSRWYLDTTLRAPDQRC
jgi:hypothetical protein